MRLSLLVLSMLSFIACGPGIIPPPAPGEAAPTVASSASPAFAGSWESEGVLAVEGPGNLPIRGVSVMTVTNGVLKVNGLCPSGGGSITVTGDGTSLDWTGVVGCPVNYDCGGSSAKFEAGHVALNADDTLTLNLYGYFDTCGSYWRHADLTITARRK